MAGEHGRFGPHARPLRLRAERGREEAERVICQTCSREKLANEQVVR